MSELSRRRRSTPDAPTIFCFCDSCDRVLYVDAGSLFCPVCSSPVLEVTPKEDAVVLPDDSETPAH